MLVAVVAALLDEDGLVDAVRLELPQARRELRRRADAARPAAEHFEPDLLAHGDEFLPDVRPPRR
ncbi:MAG: hypothetical protein Q8P98_02960, partial [Candidatus Rokubacteria bacterium]|nr:hypothetical protein [Candidatus Rokubacteria bacterium]